MVNYSNNIFSTNKRTNNILSCNTFHAFLLGGMLGGTDVVGVCTKTSLRLRGAHNEDIRAGSQPLTARIANISDLRP
ncbi:hypothetical protein J6590_001783 [Homalodisca vitripennis]|nr:hypothetical protein J6590_001783 [Homalodisca vitripennis]